MAEPCFKLTSNNIFIMKNVSTFFFIVTLIFMTACGNDKTDSPEIENLSGTYKGYTVAEFKYITIPQTTANESFSISSENDKNTLLFESNQWGKFLVSDVRITKDNKSYSIEGSGSVTMGMNPTSLKDYACTVKGSISNDKKEVTLTFSVPSVMEGLKIVFYTGDAPASMLIAGVYNGSLNSTVGETSAGTIDDSKVTIKSLENKNSEITLAAFSLSQSMGLDENVVVTEVKITTETDGSYILNGTIDTTSGTTKVTGSLTGTIKDKKAYIVFTMKLGAMPMPLVSTFTSK